MVILEHGQEQERTLLFFPCTAEPVWAFAETIALLSKTWHVLQAVFDGHQPEYPGDFTSVEQAVDEVVTAYLKSRGDRPAGRGLWMLAWRCVPDPLSGAWENPGRPRGH